jgi:multidrug resistance efflux pump
LSNQFDTEAQVKKLENQYANYSIRNGMYYIKAPQSGYVNRVLQAGIGQTVKEGTPIVSIMPAHDVAVETYVDPIDLPLINKGEKLGGLMAGLQSFLRMARCLLWDFCGKIVAIEKFYK